MRGSKGALLFCVLAFLFSFRAFLLPTAQSFQKSHVAPAISLAPAATALLPLPAQAVEGVSNFELIYGGVALFGLIIIVGLDYFKK
mmetsp:Transcript_111786/g.156772  ORF Transcript_111786/g.156772 Transcript_111786/m.156772 type:complete len:86 (-) Transcript_111786:22-279(-)